MVNPKAGAVSVDVLINRPALAAELRDLANAIDPGSAESIKAANLTPLVGEERTGISNLVREVARAASEAPDGDGFTSMSAAQREAIGEQFDASFGAPWRHRNAPCSVEPVLRCECKLTDRERCAACRPRARFPEGESAHRFADRLRHNLDELGCIMLDLDPIPVTQIAEAAGLPVEADLYRSPFARVWVDGATAERTAHVTLLYGLLQSGESQRIVVEELLYGAYPGHVQVARLGVFPSPYDDEPYDCVVAHLRADDLALAHARLSYLPHIDTHPEYQPHVTLAYVKAGRGEAWVAALSEALVGRGLRVTGLNYGGRP